MSTAERVSWGARPPGLRVLLRDGWELPPVGTGYASASGPLLRRAPPQLSRQGHEEDRSPGRGRKGPPGWVWAAKGQCFLVQGEERPAAPWRGPSGFCSLPFSQAHFLLCPACLLLSSSVRSLLSLTSTPLLGLLPAPFARNAPLCPDSHPRCKAHPRHLCLSTHPVVWRPLGCSSTVARLPLWAAHDSV